VSANSDPTTRRGAVSVNNAQVVIAQDAAPCTFTVAPTTVSAPAGGGSATIAVTASSGVCTWNASSQASWIQVSSGSGGTGNGNATLTIATNSGAARSGTVSVAGQSVTISQPAVTATCNATLSASTKSFEADGGEGSVSVSIGAGCSWSAVSDVGWVTVTAGRSGTGSGDVHFIASANPTTSTRVGTLTIVGQTFTVTEAGAAPPPPPPSTCSYTIGPTSQTVGASGGTGSVTVTAASGCSWTAATGVSWLTITAGATGSGNGTVSFTIAANSGSSRTGTLTIAGQTFTLTQATFVCTFSISPTSASFPKDGGSGTVTVTAAGSCGWTASESVSWITIDSGASGTGNGTVNYTVKKNNDGSRTGTITIAGQTFTVTQSH
jgi:hypothetical protein